MVTPYRENTSIGVAARQQRVDEVDNESSSDDGGQLLLTYTCNVLAGFAMKTRLQPPPAAG
jgi:hypothetical protein